MSIIISWIYTEIGLKILQKTLKNGGNTVAVCSSPPSIVPIGKNRACLYKNRISNIVLKTVTHTSDITILIIIIDI